MKKVLNLIINGIPSIQKNGAGKIKYQLFMF